MYKFILLAIAIQAVTSSVVQPQDALLFGNNFEARVNPITIEDKEMVTINGRRYFFSLANVNLFEAQISCEEFGMDLVSFETKAESDSIWAYIQSQGLTLVWYHTSGMKVDSNWKWSSSYLNYDNWAIGEPTETSTTSQACIYYANNLLYDHGCNYVYRFICEERVSC